MSLMTDSLLVFGGSSGEIQEGNGDLKQGKREIPAFGREKRGKSESNLLSVDF